MLANSGVKLSDPEADVLKAIGSNAGAFREKAGDIARHLAFAGIAVVWLFKVDSPSGFMFPVGLVRATGLFVLSLITDLTEYVVGTLIWQANPRWILRARTERTRWARVIFAINTMPSGNQELVARPVRWLFWLRIVSVAAGYVLLGLFLGTKSGLW